MLVCKIKKNFKNFKLDVDFSMDENYLGLLGPSGSGKSLTLKCIAGLITPDVGKIVLDDRILFDSSENINIRPQDRKIGYLFQDYALFPNFTVEGNLRLAIRDNKNIDISKILKEMHIDHIKNKYPKEISGGEAQRTALCRILINKPDILLLDEPFSALDSYTKNSVEDELRRIIDESKLKTILVSHDKDEVYRMCQSIVSIARGKTYVKKSKSDFFEKVETLTEAKLIGIENFSELSRIDSNKIYAKSWGMDFSYKEDINNKILVLPDRAIKLTNYKKNEKSFLLDEYRIVENIDYYTLIFNKDKKFFEDIRIKVPKDDFDKLKDNSIYANIIEDSLLFVENR